MRAKLHHAVALLDQLHADHSRNAADPGSRPSTLTPYLNLDRRSPPGLLLQLIGRTVADQTPAVNDENALAEMSNLGEDVGAEHDGATPGQAPDQFADLDDLARIEPHGGLVQEEH